MNLLFSIKLIVVALFCSNVVLAEERASSSLPDYTRDPAIGVPVGTPVVQLALLLDTSSSMDGLIHQAKTQLWSMVNALVKVRRDGKDPEFRVALYEYGSNSLSRESGFTRKVVGFTGDFDAVSGYLMALKATKKSGSDERCGHVLHRAIHELAWTSSSDDLKVICIAGNESFAQGGVPFRIPCELAVKNSISINTIFCGGYGSGISAQWQMGAQLGGGHYSAIDQTVAYRAVSTPQDQHLSALNIELNRTYIPFNELGIQAKQRQELADSAAQGQAPSSLSYRVNWKATHHYQTSEWDLVEACEKRDFKLAEVPSEALPPEMKEMSEAEKRAHLAKQLEKRRKIQTKITEVSAERSKFLAEAKTNSENPLEKAIIDSLHAQAEKKKFVANQ